MRALPNLLGVVAIFAYWPLTTLIAQAQTAQNNSALPSQSGPSYLLQPSSPSRGQTGPLMGAAKSAKEHGPLPFSQADVDAKNAANSARDAAEAAITKRPLSVSELAVVGGSLSGPKFPKVQGTLNFAGQSASVGGSSPPDTTGAIGPSSFIQATNNTVAIYNRSTGAVVSSNTLNGWVNVASTVNSFDPQVIWDPTTNRFYYVMDSVVTAATNNTLSLGFSKSSNPVTLTTSDWCNYTLYYGSRFPDYPKLGDAQDFLLVGVNAYPGSGGAYIGSDLIAIQKPSGTATITTCPSISFGGWQNIKNPNNSAVFSPTPANQIDTIATNKGYVVATNGVKPAKDLWVYEVSRPTATSWSLSAGRNLTVSTYSIPAAASQPTYTQTLETSDTRLTQAIQAYDPTSTKYSLWTQQTVANGASGSLVRWYKIDPVANPPILQRTGDIGAANTFLFNASISPDRRVDGATTAYGQNFVIQYSASSRANAINPRIISASSLNGAALTALLVTDGVGPYRDFTCQASGSTCRWGDYSGATPDPKPTASTTGNVWGTNQYSGLLNPPATGNNWRTQIFNLVP